MSIQWPGGGPGGDWRERVRRAAAWAGARARELVEASGGWARALAAATAPARAWVARFDRRLERRAVRAWGGVKAGAGRLVRAAERRGIRRRHLLAAVGVLLVATWGLWERCGVAGCPDVDRLVAYQPGGASVLLDRHGERFADLAPVEHEVVPLDSLPGWVADAFVAVEDRRFFEHGGVDWRRVPGAFWADLRAGGLVEGSSTITMQLSRNLFPDRIRARDRTLWRKLLEVRMAGEIEDRFTKKEILELYLNHIYFGGGAYGIQAAARFYFGKPASKLALHEAALLAALPKAPGNYDPRRSPEAARSRRNLVLLLMEEQDRLRFAEAHEARERPLGVRENPSLDPDAGALAPYFVHHVRRLLEDRLGEELYGQRLRITTTLDPVAQRAAEEELEGTLRRVERDWFGRFRGAVYGEAGDGVAGDGTGSGGGAGEGAGGTSYVQGAVVLMEAGTGDVLAWIGGRDFGDSRYDRARLARRQAGSAFKPFVYAAALEQGLAPSQLILDAPYHYALDRRRSWSPENYSGRFEGPMTMREALVHSQNVPAARLAAAVGPDAVADVASRAGLRGEVPATPVAALGVTTVSPLELTEAFSAFARLGSRIESRFVLRVESEDGDVLWSAADGTTAMTGRAGSDTPGAAGTAQGARARVTPVVEPAVAYVLTDMLRDVVDRGTGHAVRRAGFSAPAAGKTGTTSEATDVWFVGYTPEVVGTVWVGFDDVRPLPYRATGGGVAAPVWGGIMAAVAGERGAAGEWERPAGVVSRRIDPESGRVLRDGCSPYYEAARRELFLAEHEPAQICPRRSGYRGMDRFSRWLSGVFGTRRSASRADGPTDPDLGYPRLTTSSRDRAAGEGGAP